MIVRQAVESDIPAIYELLHFYARKRIVLERSPEDLLYYLKNFTVALADDGKLLGCVAVRDFSNDLLEVRSLVVAEAAQGTGVGRALVEDRIGRLKKDRKSFRLFALTLKPEFFLRLGFREIPQEELPEEKIWSDCKGCPKYDCCDELAVLYRWQGESSNAVAE